MSGGDGGGDEGEERMFSLHTLFHRSPRHRSIAPAFFDVPHTARPVLHRVTPEEVSGDQVTGLRPPPQEVR